MKQDVTKKDILARQLIFACASLLFLFFAAKIAFPNFRGQLTERAEGAPWMKETAFFKQNWGISALRADKSWPVHTCQKPLKVALIDTGIDLNHKGLSEITDKSASFDFVTNTTDPKDEHGHGTHIAGIIYATTGGGGLRDREGNPCIRIMALKYYSPKATGASNLERSKAALRFAIGKGATIINYSGGGMIRDDEEYELLKSIEASALLIAAAGNERRDLDIPHSAGYYPASYKLKNTVVVAAVEPDFNLIPSSNYGISTVHVAAPGEQIYSMLPEKNFGNMSGTSQATAFVTAVAALVWSMHPNLTPTQVRARILSATKPIKSLHGKTVTGGVLDAVLALTP